LSKIVDPLRVEVTMTALMELPYNVTYDRLVVRVEAVILDRNKVLP
jgi:hypothetical protein